MIVWLASFPRSGNTFLRILLNRIYGVTATTVYDIDGVAERLGGELVGSAARMGSHEEMRASDTIHFVKTHRQLDADVDASDRAICLVRDGRDCLVSWARMLSEDDPAQFEPQLRKAIERQGASGTGSWGTNVLSWLQPAVPQRVALRYEDLTADPAGSTIGLMDGLAPEMRPRPHVLVPSFSELREADETFFRRGLVGSHRDEMPEALHDLFWSRPDNVAAMRLLGLAP
jgi:hypothetical protein